MTHPTIGRLSTTAAPFTRYGPHGRTVVASDGVALNVSDQLPAGAIDHTVVLLHGLCLTRQSWYRPAQHLRRPGVRVIEYDHRGHGRSEHAPLHTYTLDQLAQDLADVLSALRVDGPLTLAGHSMGGMTALSYLARPLPKQPVCPQGLVLVGTSAGYLTEHGLGRLLGLPGLDTAMNVIQRVPPVVSERVMRALAEPVCGLVTHDKAISAALAEAFRSTSTTTALGFLHSLKTYDRHGVLSTIAAATTVISGGADLLTPPVHSDVMVAAIPGARRIHLPEVGHMLLDEAATVVSDAILRTIAGPDAAHRPINRAQPAVIATSA
ncbi:alpha/beta hydrolase [Mycolicibacterium sp. P9-64]|uniref:alpha/beta fold hydrolase n=1 Tax=Mycolicibacterium sp. P9-64 TaxID=2024612 RepID=UPI001F5BAB29|nr:alpha/beta hydrolase [Mycolicibacterium sp. P9-64]